MIWQIYHHNNLDLSETVQTLVQVTKSSGSQSRLKSGRLVPPGSVLLSITLFCWLVNEWMIKHLTVSQDLESPQDGIWCPMCPSSNLHLLTRVPYSADKLVSQTHLQMSHLHPGSHYWIFPPLHTHLSKSCQAPAQVIMSIKFSLVSLSWNSITFMWPATTLTFTSYSCRAFKDKG